MEDKISICIIFNSDEVTAQNVAEWFNTMIYFKPTKMRGNFLTKRSLQKYNHQKFFKGILKEIQQEDNLNLSVEDDENKLAINSGGYSEKITWLSFDLTNEIFESNKEEILNSIDLFIVKHNGIVAYACSYEDEFWQHLEDTDYYKIYKRSLENIPLIPSPLFPENLIVDIEYNPGHSHIVNGVWFGSCWKMWFGCEYFNYIPKEVLATFRNCFENTELENEVIKITLFENFWEYDIPENRAVQVAFRNQTGIDSIAHELLLEGDEPISKGNASIEILTGKFEHQGIRKITYYYDEDGEVVSKSRAIESKTYELDMNGKVVWSEINTK